MTTSIRLSVAGLLVAAAPLAAQLPNTSAAATALGDNYTARARGYEAITWNPALLAAADRPGFSIGLMMAGGASGLDPVDMSDLNAYSGQVVPAAVKQAWLEQVRTSGGQHGDADGGFTPVALSIGSFGFEYAVSAYASAALNPDAMEVMLYGNAGSTGEAREYEFGGSQVDMGVVSTIAASYAMQLPLKFTPLSGERFTVGATAKYIIGNMVARGEDGGSTTTASGVDVVFPVVHSDIDNGVNNGSGVGLDVGAAWSAGPLRVGAMLSNIVNTFAWDPARMVYRPGRAFFTADSTSSSFDTTSYASAPAALREAVEAQSFKPAMRVGVAMAVSPMLTVSADARASVGDGLAIGPRDHLGVGAELKLIPFLPLRAGVAKINDGWQAAGGLGIALGRFEIGVGATLRNRGEGKATGVTLNAVTIR